MAFQDPTASTDIAIDEISMIDGPPTVSWGAILAGALSAAALSFVLLAVGAAFGLSIASPWDFTGRNAGEAAAAAGIGTAIFLVIVHALSSGVGGYLAGRLRPKLTGLRGDETYFRDTAHGLVVWAVSALVTILLLAFVAFAVARGGIALGAAGLNAAGQAAGGPLAGAAPAWMEQSLRERDSTVYFIDALFRPGGAGATTTAPATGTRATTGQAPAGEAATGAPMVMPQATSEADMRGQREEVGRIFRRAVSGDLAPEDKTYVAQVVAEETGLPQAEAEQRVNQIIDRAKAAKAEAEQKAKEAADAARKAGMYTALWGAVAMLAGAFAASLAATWGGRARDL
ncbi:MAG TPA: hypothetical protein VFE34_24540 [Dongiaceae bacterium]|jgi:hypothetical protein|nr:hypothetical protein [Dongiaceae bacterium]